jgi:hypothetical protein
MALLVPTSASAWHQVFQDFFDVKGSTIAAGRATAKKCGPGGLTGSYDYRSSVVSSSGAGGPELEFEILAKLSVREHWRKLKQVEVNYTATNFPQDIAEQAAVALDDFHETVYTKYKPAKKGDGGRLLIRHGALEMFGSEVVAPDESKVKFDPKRGC